MSDLQPCKACARHVRADDDACPFCQAPIRHRDVRPQLPGGRLTRAAVFAGAIGAIGACDKNAEPAAPQTPPTATTDAAAARADAAAAVIADAAIPDAALPDAALPDAAPKKKRPRAKPDAAVKLSHPDRAPIPKPYGAPPARRRLV